MGRTIREDLLGIKVQMGSIDLIEPPEQIFRGPVEIIATGIVGKIVAQW